MKKKKSAVYTKKAVKAANKKKAEAKLTGKYLRAANAMARKDRSQFKYQLTQSAFKKRFQQYVRITPDLSKKRLKTQLESFLDYGIALWTPAQCRHARLNLQKHFNGVIRKLNSKKDLTAEEEKYYTVLKNAKLIERLPGGTKRLNQSKFPTYEDFHTVSAAYLRLKRYVQEVFGDDYGEAYGS